jgi:SAM-dependent methyltransferase
VSGDILDEIHGPLLGKSSGRIGYTRQAYRLLPPLDRPNILDLGCGPGVPTLELARLSRGVVTGMDTHQPYLDELTASANRAGLSEHIRTINRSMRDLDFPPGSFDVIWAEGSIWIVGFENGLREWRALIRPRGFLVVHEWIWPDNNPPEEVRAHWAEMNPGIKTLAASLEIVAASGYHLIGHFLLPENAWWAAYYQPLEQRLAQLRRKYREDPAALEVIDKEQREVDLYRKYPAWYGSAFFVMEKR